MSDPAKNSSPYAAPSNQVDAKAGSSELPAHDSGLSLSNPEAHSPADGYDDENEVDVEGGFDDQDSAFGDGGSLIGCDTDTLSSYVTDYRYENGRRYHAYRDGAYWGPNDEKANELHDLAHHMYNMTLEGKLHLAPLGRPQNILDIGTGSGIWAIEMADTYPSATVIGTDLSPIQPTWVPPNCQFEIDDMNGSWTFPRNHFDFIHMRELFGCVTDWNVLLSQSFDRTKSGGYVEIVEHSVAPVSDDDTVNEHSFFTKWGKTVLECGEKFGKSFSIWEESKDLMEKAGFVDVQEIRYKWPMNGWPSPEHKTHGDDGNKNWKRLRELGLWNQVRLYDGVESFMLRLLTGVNGWNYEEAQVFLAQMRNEIRDQNIHAYLDVSVVYGRKPD